MSLGEAAVDVVADSKGFQSSLTKGIGVAGAAVAGTAVAAGAAIGGAIFKGINQEASVDRSAAALGLSEADSERLGSVAGEVYASNFVGSVEEGAGVAQQVWRSFGDIGDEQLGRVAEGAAGLSKVFDVDVNQVIGAAQQLLEEGLAPSAEAALDAVATGLQDSKGPADEALAAINEYSTFYSQLGLDASNVIGGLTSEWANNQFAIDKTGDAIKELAVRSVDGSAATEEALGNIGLSAEDVNAAFAEGGPAAEAMTERIISSITSIEDPATRAQTGVALMGAPFEDLGDNAVPILEDVVSGMGDVEGAASSIGDQANDNIRGILTEAWRTVSQEVITGIGDKALPIIRDFSDWVKDSVPDIVDGIGNLFDAFSEGDGVVDGVLNVFSELTGGDGVGSIFEKVSEIVQDAIAGVVDWLASGGITQILNTLMQARQRLFDAAIQLFPVILDALIAFVPELLSFITGQLIPQIVDFIVTGVPQLLQAAVTLFESLIDAVIVILPMLISQLLGTVLPNLLSTILGMIPQLLQTGLTLFQSLVDAVVQILPDLLTTLLVDVLPAVLTTLLEMLPQLITTAVTVFFGLVTALLDVLPDLITTLLVDVLPAVIVTLIGMIPELITTTIEVFGALSDGIIGALPEILGTIVTEVIPAIAGAIGGLGTELFTAGVNAMGDLLGGIKDKAGEVVGWVRDNVVGAISRLWPFSPAKEGPFSGRGSPRHAGENVMALFAEGLQRGRSEVDAAARAATASLAAGLTGSAASRDAGRGDSRVVHLTVHGRPDDVTIFRARDLARTAVSA